MKIYNINSTKQFDLIYKEIEDKKLIELIIKDLIVNRKLNFRVNKYLKKYICYNEIYLKSKKASRFIKLDYISHLGILLVKESKNIYKILIYPNINTINSNIKESLSAMVEFDLLSFDNKYLKNIFEEFSSMEFEEQCYLIQESLIYSKKLYIMYEEIKGKLKKYKNHP